VIPLSQWATDNKVAQTTARRWARQGRIKAQQVGPRMWVSDGAEPVPVVKLGRKFSEAKKDDSTK
jgi:predicted site-specific integrase-resolvase